MRTKALVLFVILMASLLMTVVFSMFYQRDIDRWRNDSHRLEAHCRLMRINLDSIHSGLDKPELHDASVLMWRELTHANFRELRPCFRDPDAVIYADDPRVAIGEVELQLR